MYDKDGDANEKTKAEEKVVKYREHMKRKQGRNDNRKSTTKQEL